MSGSEDEFAEFETDEATFDAMMADAERAEITHERPRTTVVTRTATAIVTVTMPVGFPVSVGEPVSEPAGKPVPHGPGRLPVHHQAHRAPRPEEAVAR